MNARLLKRHPGNPELLALQEWLEAAP